jgi:hypothetical protein
VSIKPELCVGLILTVLAAKTVAEPLPDSAGALQPKIREIQVEKIRALTGPEAPVPTKRVDICGTDLGTMTEIGSRIFFAFGDTFGYNENYGIGSELLASPANQLLEHFSAPRANWQPLSAVRLDKTVRACMRQEAIKNVQVFVKSADTT